MLRKILFILFSACSLQLAAQEPVQRIWNELDSIEISQTDEEADLPISPLRFSTSFGTSFTYMQGFGSIMNYYAAPHMDYAAGSRLSFHGGMIASYTVLPHNFMNGEDFSMASYPSLSLFVSTTYRLTDRLYIHGTGVKSMPALFGSMNPAATDFQDLSIGATYDFGNFSIGASFHRSSGNYYSPFGGMQSGMYGSPLFW